MNKLLEQLVLTLCATNNNIHDNWLTLQNILDMRLENIESLVKRHLELSNTRIATIKAIDVEFNQLAQRGWAATKDIADEAFDICIRSTETAITLSRVLPINKAAPDIYSLGILIDRAIYTALTFNCRNTTAKIKLRRQFQAIYVAAINLVATAAKLREWPVPEPIIG